MIDRYVWPTAGLDQVWLAPFQVLASRGQERYSQSHLWHLGIADQLVQADPGFFRPTRRIEVNTTVAASTQAAVAWWEELTTAGGEGMVVKPMSAPVRPHSAENGDTSKPSRGLVQPGLKVRGREYLRITYGPDYPDHLDQLRNRNLHLKRSLAIREYALGLEAIDRLVADEPLWRRHEAVFAVLAMEAEPTDPRL